MNPGSCDPVEEFEMLPGMISPFLRPLRRTGLAAVALVPWQQVREEQETEVAVSLSLWESLLLPFALPSQYCLQLCQVCLSYCTPYRDTRREDK